MQYEGITRVGPWDVFEVSEWTDQQLEEMVESLPALPPLNYENLNKRLGELKKYPLEIPVTVIAIVLVISTIVMVVTIIIIGLVIFRLRGNLKDLLPIAKVLVGKASQSEISQIKQVFRTLLDLPPGHLIPPELPERKKSLPGQLPPIPEETSTRPGPSRFKNILPSSRDIKRYEKYLTKKKEEITRQK